MNKFHTQIELAPDQWIGADCVMLSHLLFFPAVVAGIRKPERGILSAETASAEAYRDP